jgi:hypothetical protein
VFGAHSSLLPEVFPLRFRLTLPYALVHTSHVTHCLDRFLIVASHCCVMFVPPPPPALTPPPRCGTRNPHSRCPSIYFHLQKCQGGTRMASNWAGYLVKRPGSRNNPTSHLQIPTCGLHTSCGRGVTCTKEREKRRDEVDAAEGHTEDFPLCSMSCVFLFYSTVQHGGIQGGARARAAFNLCTSRWPQQVL